MSFNFIAIAVAAIAAFIVGFLIHGPLFGKLWMKLAGIKPTGKEKFTDMIPQMLWNLLSNFIMAFVLGMWISYSGLASWYQGAILAAFTWLGFIVTSTAMEPIWMGRTVKLWLFESAASLAVIVTMGAILAGWQ